MPIIEPLLLEILVCPRCHGELRVDEPGSALVCDTDELRFPVEDGIPHMIIDE